MSSSLRIAPDLKIFSGNAFAYVPPSSKNFLKLEENKDFTELLEKYGVTDTDGFYKEANKILSTANIKKMKKEEKEEPETIEVTTAEGLKLRIPNPKKRKGVILPTSMKIETDSATLSPDEM